MALSSPKIETKEADMNQEAVLGMSQSGAVQVETQPVAQVETQPVAQVETQPVAQVETSSVPATQRESLSRPPATTGGLDVSKVTQAMAEAGFEGIELDAWSFPTIILPAEGYFQLMGDEGTNLGNEFVFVPESSTSRYVIKQDDSEEAESYNSYDQDGLTDTSGTDRSSTLAQWAADSGEDNYQPVVRPYVDVLATMIKGQTGNSDAEGILNETIMVSVPPSSRTRFGGIMVRGMKTYGPGNFAVKATVGAKVKKAQGKGFYPWVFSLVALEG